jgi:cell division transport system permease protein
MAGWWKMAGRPRLRPARLRPAGLDDLGLRRVVGDWMLPLLVAAMAFLAALALAGAVGAASLAGHWQEGAGSALTVQVPQPAPDAAQVDRVVVDRVVAILKGTPGIAAARPLTEAELTDLLRPWLGSDAARISLPLPAVIEVHLAGAGPDLDALAARLATAAPGTLVESHGVWVRRLSALARSLQACAWVALLVVAAVAAAVVAVATRAGLTARREAIEIVHGLGATDGYIARRFARRATRLAAVGGALGATAALPVLLLLAQLAAPFASMTAAAPAWRDDAGTAMVLDRLAALPTTLWLVLPGLPLAASLIGFLTAQRTVRRWLRRLP